MTGSAPCRSWWSGSPNRNQVAKNRIVIPDERGTYALILSSMLNQSVIVGRLGVLDVSPGTYVYIGSAFGPSGLPARVARHARTVKRKRWHIDYLTDATRLIETWYAVGSKKQEHAWAKALARLTGASVPMRGFGSSDCRCEGHLFHLAQRPSVHVLARVLRTHVTVTPQYCLFQGERES